LLDALDEFGDAARRVVAPRVADEQSWGMAILIHIIAL